MKRIGAASLIGLAAAAGTFVLAAGPFVAALTEHPIRPVLWALYGGQTVEPARLVAAADTLALARQRYALPAYSLDRGLLLTAAGMALPGERAALLQAAAIATERGLRDSPGQPSAWARLAWLRQEAGDRPGAGAALRLSMLTGANVPALMRSRLVLGLSLLDQLDAETRALLERQVRWTWIIVPREVEALAPDPVAGAFLAAALSQLTPAERSLELRANPGRRAD